MMKRLLLSLLSGFLLYLSWPTTGFPLLLFVAFIPLFFLEEQLAEAPGKRKGLQLFGYAFLTFAIWNAACTWWIYNAHWSGAAAAAIVNGTLMAGLFCLFHYIKRSIGKKRARIAFPFLWLSFEYLHLDWDLAWPWMNLGNAFANHVGWVQWYEYTGTFGGSFWVLLVNVLLFGSLQGFLKDREIKRVSIRIAAILLFFILCPILLSLQIYHRYSEQGEEVNIVVVQPNIDPYTEKYEIPENEQLDAFIGLAQQKLTEQTDYLIAPETFLPGGAWEKQLSHDFSVRQLKKLTEQYPDLHIVTGLTLRKRYYKTEERSPTARGSRDGSIWYDTFNAAMQLNSNDSIQVYYKSKLVAGVEMMPFRSVLKPLLGDLVLDMGGTVEVLGSQKERSVFTTKGHNTQIAPVICYESVFGAYVSDYIKKGAGLIFIITNDGWWGNTQGHKQHATYARLRAIENRRSIARSANTGISCFINQRGDMIQPQPWDTKAAISTTLKANKKTTFYTRNGDGLSRLSLFLSVVFIIYAFVKKRLKKKTFGI